MQIAISTVVYKDSQQIRTITINGDYYWESAPKFIGAGSAWSTVGQTSGDANTFSIVGRITHPFSLDHGHFMYLGPHGTTSQRSHYLRTEAEQTRTSTFSEGTDGQRIIIRMELHNGSVSGVFWEYEYEWLS